jgi:hypothetical protein
MSCLQGDGIEAYRYTNLIGITACVLDPRNPDIAYSPMARDLIVLLKAQEKVAEFCDELKDLNATIKTMMDPDFFITTLDGKTHPVTVILSGLF